MISLNGVNGDGGAMKSSTFVCRSLTRRVDDIVSDEPDSEAMFKIQLAIKPYVKHNVRAVVYIRTARVRS
jgi:hypothetical protein